jgi:hypothetical protein
MHNLFRLSLRGARPFRAWHVTSYVDNTLGINSSFGGGSWPLLYSLEVVTYKEVTVLILPLWGGLGRKFIRGFPFGLIPGINTIQLLIFSKDFQTYALRRWLM